MPRNHGFSRFQSDAGFRPSTVFALAPVKRGEAEVQIPTVVGRHPVRTTESNLVADDSPVNTNKQRFPLASKCEMDFVHQYLDTRPLTTRCSQLPGAREVEKLALSHEEKAGFGFLKPTGSQSMQEQA